MKISQKTLIKKPTTHDQLYAKLKNLKYDTDKHAKK